jgi:hypothetical protein
MKRFLPILLVAVFVFSGSFIYSQCTPGNEETCPDPENNGEVCPDSLATGFQNVYYNQEITILPPQFYEFGGNVIELHSIKLHGLDNLPPGLGWISNSPDSVFMAGEYYCVLIDGTPEDTGEFHLYINIEVFVEIAQNVISAGTIQDSTLTMYVLPESAGIDDNPENRFMILETAPNPFENSFEIGFFSPRAQEVNIQVYDLTGQAFESHQLQARQGINQIQFDSSAWNSGMFICTISSTKQQHSVKLVKR